MIFEHNYQVDPLLVYIVIPVYNHDEHLRTLIVDLRNTGFSHIIVVDDGSERNIYENISDLDIHFIRHKLNLGQGAALQTGFEFAKSRNAPFVVSFDADGQHSVADLKPLLEPVWSGKADISLGSRFLSDSETPAGRKRVLQVARLVNYLLTNIKLSDAHNGLRAMNNAALTKLRITENRMAHATEILIEAKKHQLRIAEVPVTIYYTDYSRKNGQSSWNSIRILLDLILYKLFA